MLRGKGIVGSWMFKKIEMEVGREVEGVDEEEQRILMIAEILVASLLVGWGLFLVGLLMGKPKVSRWN